MLIYKIFRAPEWAELERKGETAGAPVDRADGYVHFSAPHQLRATAAKWFAQEDDLVLVTVEADALGEALRWEPSRGGDLFPHLYRPLRRADVARAAPLPRGAEGHVFGQDIP